MKKSNQTTNSFAQKILFYVVLKYDRKSSTFKNINLETVYSYMSVNNLNIKCVELVF